jgi:hypothetical protein
MSECLPGQEIVVFWVLRDTKCAESGRELFRGSLLRMEKDLAGEEPCAFGTTRWRDGTL